MAICASATAIGGLWGENSTIGQPGVRELQNTDERKVRFEASGLPLGERGDYEADLDPDRTGGTACPTLMHHDLPGWRREKHIRTTQLNLLQYPVKRFQGALRDAEMSETMCKRALLAIHYADGKLRSLIEMEVVITPPDCCTLRNN
ncbi:hypothetical protein EYF80_023672 [Liparis tanakae]|uniref:Uncharacterized protein n=1 Tax=Liparis tanakae TaxID=230148 RepID=A0A4Z2HML7_9TELE|nr:hypothetical protein EYF80_023672 [Liparis tanakae]